jgi:hypothetical protein
VILRLRDEAIASLTATLIEPTAKVELESLALYVTDRLT